MKKLFMLFALVSLVGTASVTAQTCSKSKAECTAAATKVAASSADIEKRICEKSGKVSFVRKGVCAVSGKTSYTNVEYNADTKKFVNISPSHTSGKAAKKACCAGKEKAACSTGKAKATSASASKKGACCSKGKAACTKKSTTTTAKKSDVKVVKTSSSN